jgi:hypothetical protein
VPRKILLVELIQAYAPLAPHKRIELKSLLVSSRTPEAEMIKTWFELEREEGAKTGKLQGIEGERRASLRRLLERRFGALSPTALQRLEKTAVDALVPLFDAACTASSLADLGLE